MPRPNIWNSKTIKYSPDLTYEDFVTKTEEGRVIKFQEPVNGGSEPGWAYKNLVTKDIGSNVYVAWIHMDAGGGHNYHAHSCDEIVHVLEGEAQFTYLTQDGKDKKNILKKGDTAFGPAGTPHSFWNVGDGACSFIVIKSPPYFLEDIPLPREIKERNLAP